MSKMQCFLVAVMILVGLYVGLVLAMEYFGAVNLKELARWLMDGDIVSKVIR